MARAGKVHRLQLPDCGVTECGIDIFGPGVLLDARKRWAAVTCKNCLRRRPREERKINVGYYNY